MDHHNSTMDPSNEFGVDEGAFWHTNMDLYYGYQAGEVVEVQHEANKYWLATVEYSFRHLILLKWVGNYGEFWVDTSLSQQQQSTSSSADFDSAPKRLFPPGHHLQSQFKSQFKLERPTKVLVKPSLYNPANDPYAEIKTVDDLLTHEIDHQANDVFANRTSANPGEPASLAIAKCKTKISYGPEDVDELEAALQNLNDIDSNAIETRHESSESFNLPPGGVKVENVEAATETTVTTTTTTTSSQACKSELEPDLLANSTDSSVEEESKKSCKLVAGDEPPTSPTTKSEEEDHEMYLDLCKSIQDSARDRHRYIGLEENSNKVYFLKPRQIFDIGGANHEKVLVPGTLLEIAHSLETDSGLELCYWFAFVVKNVGGRLTLRWFLCDDPKFKQGRLELKSCRSEYVREEEDPEEEDEVVPPKDSNEDDEDEKTTSGSAPKVRKILAKDLIFNMHFCNPCIRSMVGSNGPWRMPEIMSSVIHGNEMKPESAECIQKCQTEFVLDARRRNLDKDRTIIDHLLSTIRWSRPSYIHLSFSPKDTNSRREVLLSTPKNTKLLRGHIKRELEVGVFEVHSEPVADSGEVIKFIYPCDDSYSILPTNWAVNNEDCLSVHPSRNTSPTPTDNPPSSSSPSSSSGNNTTLEKTSASITENEESDVVNQTDSSYEGLGQPARAKYQGSKYEPVDIRPYTLLCEIEPSTFNEVDSEIEMDLADSDELSPDYWSLLKRVRELNATEFHCSLNTDPMDRILSKFKIMDQLEVVHPSSDVTICLGRIRKIVYPLLWIQISADSYTLLPFNSTNIYPSGWCESNNHPLVSLLPPRKRVSQAPPQSDKKRKRAKNCDEVDSAEQHHQQQQNSATVDTNTTANNQRTLFEKEHFDLGALNDKQLDIDYILNQKTMYIRIYFNHKCFTGPSLSKGKICSLPQYVGPGPLRLVMDEVVTKVISVAYVPPRILNDLSSKSFEDLLIARKLINTAPMEFKAKYQKRVHREDIPVCLNPEDVALYCECICEHLKCCYNLFGPNLYDGDDCPGHCRALTKSNKFMKRATYYREKARLGEFINDGNNKKSNSGNSNSSNKTSRPRYAGRDSSESTASSVISRTEQLNSRASSAGDNEAGRMSELKENLNAVEEMEYEEELKDSCVVPCSLGEAGGDHESSNKTQQQQEQHEQHHEQQWPKWPNETEFEIGDNQEFKPDNWTAEDVAEQLEWCRLGKFKMQMISEGVDGQALLLLDKVAIREHFQQQPKSEFTQEEVGKLSRFVEFVKARAASAAARI